MRLTYLLAPAMLIVSVPCFGAQTTKQTPKTPTPTPLTMEVAPVEESAETPATSTPVGIEPQIGIDAKNRSDIGAILNATLADEFVIYVKTLNYHWNVLGMNFNDLHLFFGKQYEELAGFVDMVAERVRILGLHPFSTMQEFIAGSHLKEAAGQVTTAKEMIKNLLDDHETLIRQMRADADATAQLQDMGTNNFLIGLLEKHEKMAWMLRSYLSEKEA